MVVNPFRPRPPERAQEYAATAWDRLYPVAWSLTGQHADAEDLVQDTLAKVLTNWERIDRAEGADAYVRAILVNTFLSGKRRRSSTEIPHAEPRVLDVGQDASEQVVERQARWADLAGLKPQQRAILVLRYYEDLPDAEIAGIIGTSPANVRVIAHRALAVLRTQAEHQPSQVGISG